MKNRRQFISLIPLAGAALAAGSVQAQALVDENDATAKSLGYVADAAKIDKTKVKNFVAGSHCGNCALYTGKAGAASGGCPLFTGKQVAAKGWCSAYAKKP